MCVPSRMIKALIFDLGNVIVPFDFRRGYAQMERLCAYPVSEIPRRIGATDLTVRFESGQIGPEAFVDELRALLGLKVEYAEFCRIFGSVFLPDTLVPPRLLESVKGRYPLVLLSNTNAIHWQMLRRTYALLDLFDHHVLSFEVGALKPAPKIYREAVARAGARPEECFFTDDVPAYVDAATKEGLDAVQFTTLEGLERALRERGVEL